jgi:WD40 repeat protein
MLISQEGAAALTPVTGPRRFRVVATEGGEAAVSPDRRYGLSIPYSENMVEVRRAGGGRVLAKLRASFAGTPRFSPRDSGLALVPAERGVLLWRWRSHRIQRLRVPGQRRVDEPSFPPVAEFSQDGDLVVSAGGEDGRAHVWDARTGTHRSSTPRGDDWISRATLSADGKRMLTVGDQAATIRSTSTGRALALLAGHSDTIADAAFSPDRALVATAAADGTARVWDAASGQQLMELRGHSAPVVEVAFSPDGRFVLSAGEDGSARLWEVASASVLRPDRGVRATAMSPDGRRVAVADENGALRLWTPATGKQRRLARTRRGIRSVAFSPRGDLVAAGGGFSFERSKSKTAVVVNLDKNTVRTFSHAGVSDVAFDDAGKSLLTVSDGHARLWDPYAPAHPARQDAGKDDFTSGTFSRDGRILLMRGSSKPPRVFDPASEEHTDLKGDVRAAGEEATDFFEEPDFLEEPREPRGDFSPDGHWVVTPARREAFVWDSRTGQVRSQLSGHTGRVLMAVYSEDGRYIATASADRTVRVWDARTGRSLAMLQSHAAAVSAIAFTPSGKEILSTGADDTVRISPCYVCRSTDELRSLAASRITRDLTRGERLAFLGESD